MQPSVSRSQNLRSLTTALLQHVPVEALEDLRSEDPAVAVEVHFGPVGFQPLPSGRLATGECATDGYYDPWIDPNLPWIIYADDVDPARIRFTVLHELGHHLLATAAASLLDDLDQLGGSSDGAGRAEEALCHHFAGRLLVSDELLASIIGKERIIPSHVQSIHEHSLASWEAVAVRIAEAMSTPGAVVLLRGGNVVAFCAASSRMGLSWWPRGSRLDPAGPLAHGLSLRQTALPETYRFGLAYPMSMFCDTLPIHGGLAIGVLSEKPSDGSLSIIEQPEPAWRERVEFCEWHPGVERDVSWCPRCKGRRCPECGRCGCDHPAKNTLCPECGLLKPFRQGATMCFDCEADRS